MNLRLHQLRALLAVVDHGSIRAAARALHLSQAALTKALRQLEEDAGVALLVRRSSGVQLTTAGQQLLPRARLIARQLELAGDELRAAQAGQAGTVRVGLTPFITLTVLGQAFAWFRQRYPHVQVQILEGLVKRVAPALRDGSMDFAIVASNADVPPAEFSSEVWVSHPQTIVVQAGHPVLANPSAEALVALEWVLPGVPDPQAPGADYLQPMFERAGLRPPAMLARGDAMAAIALVRHAGLVSVFPQPLLEQPESRGIVALSVPGLQPDAVQLERLQAADAPLTAPAAYLAHCLRTACAL